MLKALTAIVLLITSSVGFAGPAVLVEEGGVSTNRETKIFPISSSKRKAFLDETEEFNDSWALRSKRRVGLAAIAAGKLGMYGIGADLNFNPEDSVMIGFGGGPKYNSTSFEWKHLFGNTAFVPYFSAGYAYWYSVPGNGRTLETTSPSFLASRFLSQNERATGKFGLSLLVPSLGMQYFQLSGPSVGVSVFLEVNLLMAFEQISKPVPTGSMGAAYYF